MRPFIFRTLAILAVLAVAACTSTEAVLDPKAVATAQPSTPGANPLAPQQNQAASPPAATPQQAASPQTQPQTAAVPLSARVRFAPVVGATIPAAKILTDSLAALAPQKGLVLVSDKDPSATHVVKGYFSAISEDKETTVIYVWDVLDAAGNRLHRIQGQEKSQGVSPDAWSSVTPQAMQKIADETLGELAGFLSAKRG